MFIPMPIVIGVTVLLAILLVLLARRAGDTGEGSRRDSLMGTPRGNSAIRPATPTVTALPPAAAEAARALVAQNRKIEAIKLVRDATHMGLKEAKDLVDRMG